mmetsp:Transcript_9670/g.22210  ORF Transcript_9670/g.22210 Transcript_9670/m.22210 type:complete len:205 (+) Transcript_9670:91-705(+)
MTMATGVENYVGGDNDADTAAGLARPRPEIHHPSLSPPHPESAPLLRSSILKLEADSRRNVVTTRGVSFDSVDIRSYDRCVGDNPSCSNGAPLSLGWNYSESSIDLDEYEMERSSLRTRPELVGKAQRFNILIHEWDIEERELKASRKETRKVQKQRKQTLSRDKTIETINAKLEQTKSLGKRLRFIMVPLPQQAKTRRHETDH